MKIEECEDPLEWLISSQTANATRYLYASDKTMFDQVPKLIDIKKSARGPVGNLELTKAFYEALTGKIYIKGVGFRLRDVNEHSKKL